jgi:hypothetical protein
MRSRRRLFIARDIALFLPIVGLVVIGSQWPDLPVHVGGNGSSPTTPKQGDARRKVVDEVFAIYSGFLGIASFSCLILLWLIVNFDGAENRESFYSNVITPRISDSVDLEWPCVTKVNGGLLMLITTSPSSRPSTLLNWGPLASFQVVEGQIMTRYSPFLFFCRRCAYMCIDAVITRTISHPSAQVRNPSSG